MKEKDKKRKPGSYRAISAIWLALRIAVIGASLLAIGECLGAAWINADHLYGEPWPKELLVASLGKAAVSHTILWCPLLVLVAIGHWLVMRRRTYVVAAPAIIGAFLILVSLIIVPIDLSLAGWKNEVLQWAGAAVGVVASVAVWILARRVARRWRTRYVVRITNAIAAICLVVTLISGFVFVRSPLWNAATYRLNVETDEPSAGEGRDETEAGASPNVLWLMLDTVRADHMGCYGYEEPTTPFLNSWARQSIVYRRTAANGMWTVPSHCAMFTGLPVRQHGTDFGHLWLDDALSTVAEVLRDGGYDTAAFSNNLWVSPRTNLLQGFKVTRVVHYLRQLSRFSLEHLAECLGIKHWVPWFDTDFGAAITNRLIQQWLNERAGSEAPVFLFVNYMEAHAPYRIPASYRRLMLTDDEVHRSYQLKRLYGAISPLLQHDFNIDGPDVLPPADRALLKRQYDAAIRYVDHRASELIGLFESLEMLDNTLVIVTSDHGEHLNTHGMWGHTFLLYQDAINVALLIHEPGRREMALVDTPVQPSELYRTIVTATVGKPSDSAAFAFGARNLLDFMEHGKHGRMVVSEYTGTSKKLSARVGEKNDPDLMHRIQPQLAAQDVRFKYLVSGDGQRELYNLESDPDELHNLIDVLPDEAARLADYIDTWMHEVPTYVPSDPDADAQLDSATLDGLRSLGYVGNDD